MAINSNRVLSFEYTDKNLLARPGEHRLTILNPLLWDALCKPIMADQHKSNKKELKMTFFGHFWVDLYQTRILPKNPDRSLLSIHSPLTSYKKSEKTNEPFPKENYENVYFWAIWELLGMILAKPECF